MEWPTILGLMLITAIVIFAFRGFSAPKGLSHYNAEQFGARLKSSPECDAD